MTQLKWYDLASVDLDDEPERIIRNTPEVHDCEWEPELSPWHDVKRCAAVVVPLLIALPTLFYALSELREPLGSAAKATLEILGLPTW